MPIMMQGWVEIQQFEPDEVQGTVLSPWVAAIRAGSIADYNSDMFGSLFGVRNVSRFRPVAAGRGFPTDPSLTLAKEIEQLGPDLARGDAGSASWLTWAEISAIKWNEPAETTEPVGLSSIDHVATRREALDSSWPLLFDLMRRLARDYGPERVRLAVYFIV